MAALRMGAPGQQVDDRTLLDRAGRCDNGAFAEIYRRHSAAACRVATAVLRGPDAEDAVAEAFTKLMAMAERGEAGHILDVRAYLLTATRRCAIDLARRRKWGEIESTDGDDATVVPDGLGEPGDVVIDLSDRRLAATAFKELPSRWQQVLWLTEIEGLDAREAAPRLGMNANSVAQLAFRARARLRELYLDAHVRAGVAEECEPYVRSLPAHALGRLSARRAAALETHLEGCRPCRHRRDEVDDVAGTLKRALVPFGLTNWLARIWQIPSVPPSALSYQAADPHFRAPRAAVAAVVAGVLALGTLGVGGGDDSGVETVGAPRPAVDVEGAVVGAAEPVVIGAGAGDAATPPATAGVAQPSPGGKGQKSRRVSELSPLYEGPVLPLQHEQSEDPARSDDEPGQGSEQRSERADEVQEQRSASTRGKSEERRPDQHAEGRGGKSFWRRVVEEQPPRQDDKDKSPPGQTGR